MQNTFHLVISSVGETFFDGEVSSATFPGTDGELTILAGHEPIVTTLKRGTISTRIPSGEVKKFKNEVGILECSQNRAIVLL